MLDFTKISCWCFRTIALAWTGDFTFVLNQPVMIFRGSLTCALFGLLLVLGPTSFGAEAGEDPSVEKPVLRIATGSNTGTYFRIGKVLASKVAEKELPFDLEIVATSGSVDNIRRLAAGTVDLAVVQNDIAYLAERGQAPFANKIEGLSGLMMLYAEPVLVFRSQSGLGRLTRPVPTPVATGPLGSGLSFNSRTILKAMGAWDSVTINELNPDQVAAALVAEEIHLAFSNRLDDQLSRLLENGEIGLASLQRPLRQSLIRTYPFYEPYDLEIDGGTWHGIAVRSMIIARSDLADHWIDPLHSLLFSEVRAILAASKSNLPLSDSIDPVAGMSLNDWHPVAHRRLLSEGLLSPTGISRLALPAGAVLLALLFLYCLLNLWAGLARRWQRALFPAQTRLFYLMKQANLFIFKWKYLCLGLLLAGIFTYVVLSIEHLEKEWAIANTTTSYFAQQNFADNLLWMLIFAGTGYADSLFPQSPQGKFLATLLPLVGASGILTLLGLITTDHIKRHILEIRGLRSKYMEEHILICGWNPTVPRLVRSLTSDELETRRPIMILAEPKEEQPLEAYDIKSREVALTRGSATRRDDLKKAHFARASTAIIVADEGMTDPDATNVLKVLTIEKLARELEESGEIPAGKNIYTIAEISDPENYATLARDAMVDEIVSIGHIESNVLVQSALNHGVSTFLNEVLTFNSQNEFYSYRIRPRGSLTDLTYDELLPQLRQEGVLLLAISLECGGDHKRQKEAMETYELNRSLLSNPSTPAELRYRTRPGDLLIVLAESESHLNRAIRKVRARMNTVQLQDAGND